MTPVRFRLFPFRSPLLRESLLLSSPQGTEMFQFPWFPLPALCVQAGVPRFGPRWVSPFGHPRIKAWEVTPRGLSQPPTSFFGFRRQGIHRWLFIAWKKRCSCSLWSSQGAVEHYAPNRYRQTKTPSGGIGQHCWGQRPQKTEQRKPATSVRGRPRDYRDDCSTQTYESDLVHGWAIS